MIDFSELRKRFSAQFGRPAAAAGWAPGRVNLIGEHVDYNQGLVLPIAIDRGIGAAVAQRQDSELHLISLNLDQRVDLLRLPEQRSGNFSDYLCGVLHELHRLGLRQCGWDALLWGDMPVGGGLSSSAALELCFGLAVCAANGLEIERERLALACQAAENGFVGMRCGILDQFASALCRPGQALLIDCRSLEQRHIPLPADIEIAVIDSGLSRELASSGYNQRRAECEAAARALGLASLRDARLAQLEAARLEPALARRARHVISEIDRVSAAAQALTRGDVAAFGRLLDRSHASLRDDYQVSTPELDWLCARAGRLPGVLGSRLVGAGFGGCTLHVTQRGIFDALRHEVLDPYAAAFGRRADPLLFNSAAGASLQ